MLRLRDCESEMVRIQNARLMRPQLVCRVALLKRLRTPGLLGTRESTSFPSRPINPTAVLLLTVSLRSPCLCP